MNCYPVNDVRRVLVVSDLYPPESVGGMAQYAWHFAKYMSRRSEVYVLIPRNSSKNNNLEATVVACLTRIGIIDKIIISYFIFSKRINLIHITTGGFSFFHIKRDLIYLQRLVGNDFIRPWLNRSLIIRRILYRIFLITGHVALYHQLNLKYRRRCIEKQLYKADSIVLNSMFTRDLLDKYIGVHSRVQIRPGGYDSSIFNLSPASDNLSKDIEGNDMKLLVTASNLVDDKRLDRVINIF